MTDEAQIDESLYSRALLVYGFGAMKRLASSSVLISGMGGLGVEIAKNIILAGVQRVTVHDLRSAELRDLASNFYLTPESIGKNRALASLPQLITLNDYVTVTAETSPLTEELLLRFKCVVLTDFLPESEILRISTFCRTNNICFILSEARGVFGYLFNDFGPSFTVQEPSSKEASRFLINFISNGNPALLDLVDGEKHGLGINSFIRIEGVEGMTELNGKEFEVEDVSPTCLKVFTDTTGLPRYANTKVAAVANEIIHPLTIAFKPLREALPNGEAFPYDTKLDQAHYDRDQQVVLAFLSAARARDTPGDFLTIARAVNTEFSIVETIDEPPSANSRARRDQ
jgi:ubiquitin-activating enzyme E1